MVATLERIARVEAIPLSPIHTNQASTILARAYLNDPAYVELIPNERDRMSMLNTLWSGVVTYCLGFGEVYATPAVEGVACWLSPDHPEASMWGDLPTRMALPRAVMMFSGAERKRFMAALEYMDELRRSLIPSPHWYMWGVGVDPPHRGKGIGGALIAPVLERAAASGTACYLETLNEGNLPLMQEHGFHVVHSGLAPGLNLPIWALRTG